MSQSIAFRVDSSRIIGLGHLMRCLTLANALREGGGQCLFVMRNHEGNAARIVKREGHDVAMLPAETVAADQDSADDLPKHAAWLGARWDEDARQTLFELSGRPFDWLVVDHYGIDFRWQKMLRAHVGNIMVIDDLADRRHDCDVLLDQTYGRNAADYGQLTPQGCKVLAGSQYAVLRPEFAALRAYSLARRANSKLERILISMGGTDPDNVTVDVLAALKLSPLPTSCTIDVVLGSGAPCVDAVRQVAAEMPWPTTVRVDVSDMAQLMAGADLAIGAAGATSWERCCLGVPSIIFVLAENQRMVADNMEEVGAAVVLSSAAGLLGKLRDCVSVLVKSPDLRSSLSAIAATLTDGNGAMRVSACLASRVAR